MINWKAGFWDKGKIEDANSYLKHLSKESILINCWWLVECIRWFCFYLFHTQMELGHASVQSLQNDTCERSRMFVNILLPSNIFQNWFFFMFKDLIFPVIWWNLFVWKGNKFFWGISPFYAFKIWCSHCRE